MGCESNYQVKVPSKQLIRNFSTIKNPSNLNPWFLTGFSDAESSFVISIYRDEKSKLKWRVTASFSIHIHIKDIALLEQIGKYFDGGSVTSDKEAQIVFESLRDIETIINHFDKYPLRTKKLEGYILFRQAFLIIKDKKHP